MYSIGILTFHRPINYGAYLQSFSLCEALNSRDDVKCEIVDYIAPMERKKIYINLLREFKHHGVIGFFNELAKIKTFKKSLSFLSLSKKRFCTNNLKELYEWIDATYDVLIIGSDAVFNWNQNGYPTAFIPNHNFKNCKVMTYAASVHGLNYLNEEKERLICCGRFFKSAKFIGVRDACTEKFVKMCASDVSPIHCCDPTLFINIDKIMDLGNDYKRRIRQKYKIDLNKKYIIIMIPDSTLIKTVYERYKNEYTIITLFKPSRYADCYLYDLTPFEWANVIGHSELVITSYFHGSLLSVVQGVPAVAIDYSNYTTDFYEGKLKDLFCTRLKLEELFFEKSDADDGQFDKIIQICDCALDGKYTSSIENSVKKERLNFANFTNEIDNFKIDY